MRRTRKLLVVSLACAGVITALLLTAVLTTHLLANRDIVKSFIVGKTAQAIGGELVYDRLEVGYLPMPHLKALDIDLRRQDAFYIAAEELSVYPKILPLFKGRLSIHRLSVVAPDVTVRIGSDPMEVPVAPEAVKVGVLQDGFNTIVGGLFAALATIDPGTDLQIEQGAVALAFSDAPDIRISRIDAAVSNDDGNLSLTLQCQSDLTGNLTASAKADVAAMQASGQISLTAINLRPLVLHASLPGGLTAEETRATVNATFAVAGPKTVSSRFDLRFPSLTVKRGGRKLDLDTVGVAGSVEYADNGLSVSIDALESARPALKLSADASIQPADKPGKSVMEVNAAAGELDVALAGMISRAIAGDLDGIRTAFSVAKDGRLTNVTYFAGFDVGESGWHLNKMKAAGHLARGRVTIPGIDADLERMDGDVIYEDRHVAFKNVSGHFKGARFQQLDAAIDWEQQPTLMIASPSVAVDASPMYNWLTEFEGLAGAKKMVAGLNGKASLSKLEISGPLAEPADWSFDIAGTPQAISLKSPLVPFEIRLSGGEFTYSPGRERATDVRFEFLDGSFVASYRSTGIINPESITCRIDGSMGQEALAWLITILPIPEHLQIKPPVDLSGVKVTWENTQNTVSIIGGLETAGDVALFTDLTRYPDAWQIRKLQFSDGRSKATVSALIQGDLLELVFSGNVEGQTADRLLSDNRTLSGRMEGDFRIVVDNTAPLNSNFAGKISGQGLHLRSIVRVPVELKQFAFEGHDNQLKIAPSTVSLLNSQMVVDGQLKRNDESLVFDLNVNADRLDEALIRALQPAAEVSEPPGAGQKPPATLIPRGKIHLNANDFTFGRFTWSPLEADIRIDGDQTDIRVVDAKLCGISTTGEIEFSPNGLAFNIFPAANDESIQQTQECLWQTPVEIDASYDLTGVIRLPPTRDNPIPFVSGNLELSSQNGRIVSTNVWTRIASYLRMNRVFDAGNPDSSEKGFLYTTAHVKAQIQGGKALFEEILLDGDALKITGQGNLDLQNATADIILLAAPLKTVDRIVNKIPVIGYIAGGSLISIPIRIRGNLNELKVQPMRPADVGQGVLGIMKRTLKAPFKLVEGSPDVPPQDTTQKGP